MSHYETIARKYFEAFHAGRLDEVFSYFAENGVVKYGTEPEKLAKDFFPETKELIAGITFTTHGIYDSEQTNNVIIHFSFTMPTEGGEFSTMEAIDIIEFDENDRIACVKVITNEEKVEQGAPPDGHSAALQCRR